MPVATDRNFEDQIASSIKVVLETGRELIQKAYYDLTPNEEFAIYSTRQGQLSHFPAIEIVRINKKIDWQSFRFRREKYTFNIDCSVKSLSGSGGKRDVGTELLTSFSCAVMNWLNTPKNIDFDIQGTSLTVQDSLATGVDTNFRRGFGLRSARISYWTYLFNHVDGPVPDPEFKGSNSFNKMVKNANP
jgi:hypothetical protein